MQTFPLALICRHRRAPPCHDRPRRIAVSTRLTRRQFVQASAALGTTLLAGARRFAAFGAAGPNDEIRTAIIGIRNQGKEHIRYHAGLTGVRIVTLCDIDERLFSERVGTVAGGPPKTETDLRRVLDDKNVDAVILTVPNHWHAWPRFGLARPAKTFTSRSRPRTAWPKGHV